MLRVIIDIFVYYYNSKQIKYVHYEIFNGYLSNCKKIYLMYSEHCCYLLQNVFRYIKVYLNLKKMQKCLKNVLMLSIVMNSDFPSDFP